MDAFDAFAPGRHFGKLLVERLIGEGAFARVFLARDTLVGRPVAVKVLRTPAADVAPLLAEAQLIGRIQSPHVVTLYAVHEFPGGWAFEMEYEEGGSLEALLEDTPRPPAHRTVEILKGIARGLLAAHGHGIVHGDVKPANVLLAGDGTSKLADFGLGRFLHDASLSLKGEFVGTPRYMAPEVIMGQPPRAESDVWSFGVILYRLLAGRLPFDSTTLHALFHAIQNAEPPPLEAWAPPDLARLAFRCLAKAPTDRPHDFAEILGVLEGTAPAREPAPTVPEPRQALFGRAGEIDEVDQLLGRVGGQTGAALLVTGEAGIGKSALATEIGARARRRGFGWLEVRISPIEGFLRPLFEILRRRISGGALRESARIEGRPQLVWAVEELIRKLAAERPLGLLVEDAHEADEDEVRLLAELATRLARQPILLAVTYRAHDRGLRGHASARYHILAAREEFRHLELDDLPPEAIARVLDAEAEPDRIDAEVAQGIVRLADGNPLFAKEMLRHLVERGAVVRREGRLGPGPGWAKRSLPRRIRDLLGRRIEDLAPDTRALLDVAAVDGIDFDGQAVAAVLDLPLLQVLRALQNLYRQRALILPRATGYRFAHALLQELIYEQAAPALRREIHRRLAEHLEAREGGVDPERLGSHWERAGDLGRARPHLLAAAFAAERRQEVQRTIDLCRRAGLEPGRIDRASALEHVRALTSLANCLSDAGRHDEAEAVFRDLTAAAEAAHDEQLRLRLEVRRARLPRGLLSADPALLMRAAETLPVSRELALAHYDLGILAKRRGDLGESAERFRTADRIYLEIGSQTGHSDALDQLGTLARRSGRLEEAERLFAEAARVSRRVGRRSNAAVSEVNRSLVAFTRGAIDGLDETLRASIRELELEGTPDVAAHARLILGHVVFALGRVEEARGLVREVHDHFERSGYVVGLGETLLLEADLERIGGNLAEAQRLVGAAESAVAEGANRNLRPLTAAILALCRCHAGEMREAGEEARRCLGLAAGTAEEDTRDDALLRIAEAVLFGAPVDAAAAAAAGVEAWARGLPLTVFRGCLAWRRADGAAREIRAAAEALASPALGEHRALMRALGAWLGACALHREGDRDAAARAASAARERALALGHLWLEAALLADLHAWTGRSEYAQRREELLARRRTL